MAFKIALNAGHGLYTPGKRCSSTLDSNETREWYLNSRICNKIEDKLKAYSGYELIRLDDVSGKVDVTLKNRTSKANAFKADIYLSIHHNAGVKGGPGGGVIAIVYTKVDDVTVNWQEAFYNEIIAKTGLKGNRSIPLQKQDLHEVRETTMPAVLLECGFMDSSTDVPIILTDDYADKVAEACVTVLVSKGGLTKIEPVAPVVPVAPVTKSIEDIAKEVIAGKWGNGSDRKNRLAAAGYKYSDVQKAVNALCKNPMSPTKSVDDIAREVLAGKWGNGSDRKKRLTAAGYNYKEVQKAVNKLCK